MAPADNKDLDDGAGKAASGGSNGQGLLNRPISELTNEEFAAVKIEIRRSLELQEACGGAEAAAANEKFQRIIAEIEDLKENEFELRLKEIAKRHGVSAGLLRKWWRQLHQSLNETRPGGEEGGTAPGRSMAAAGGNGRDPLHDIGKTSRACRP